MNLIAKRWLWLTVGACILAATWHVDRGRQFAAGKVFARDSITAATQRQLDSLFGVLAERNDALLAAQHAQAPVIQQARTSAARANAASGAATVARAALSPAARADSTVTAFASRCDTLAARTMRLTATLDSVIVADSTVIVRAMQLHAADTAAVRRLAGSLVIVRDSLAAEVRRPKRTWKSNALLVVSGAALYGISHAVWHR